MPGAFEYLGPTAPKPDPGVLMSGLPSAAPYSHVPTTGEVSNVSRPTDVFADRVAQGVYDASPLSLGPAAYGVGQMAGEAIQDMDPAQGAFAGVNAMFLGLPGMRNLQKAGRIKPGARGSEEAFKKAQKGWQEGVDPGMVWDDTGWASGKEFGAFSDGSGPRAVAWHGLPDLDVQHYNPGTYTGTIGSMGVGVDDVNIAQPGLLNLPAKFNISAEIPRAQWGGSMGTGSPGFGGAPRFTDMSVTAPDGDTASLVYAHELQHGLQGVDNIDWKALASSRAQTPNNVTNAWRHFKANQDTAHGMVWDELKGLPTGHPDKERLLKIAGDANHNANTAGFVAGETNKFARYANAPHEQQARITAAIYGRGRKAVEDGVYPGDISAFSEEAFYPFTAKGNPALSQFGLTWEDFRALPKK